jgi:hypothetical protein
VSRWRPAQVLASWATCLLALFGGNVLFHGHLAAAYFDRALAGIAVPMAQLSNPVYPLLAAAWMAAGTIWFTARGERAAWPRDGALVGGWVGLIAYGTWNVINLELIPRWPLSLTLWDSAWHVAHGAAAGALAGWILRAMSR